MGRSQVEARVDWLDGQVHYSSWPARFLVKTHTEFSYSYFPWLSAVDG